MTIYALFMWFVLLVVATMTTAAVWEHRGDVARGARRLAVRAAARLAADRDDTHPDATTETPERWAA